MRPRSSALVSCALVLSASVGLTACSSTSGGGGHSSSSSAETPPAQRLAAAKKVLDATSGVHLKLSSTDFPKGENGVTGGEGDGSHAPAFKGTLSGQLSSLQATFPVVAVDGKVWAKLPIWPKMRTIKPADYGAPDPAKLFATHGGLSDLLIKAQDPHDAGQARAGRVVVHIIKAKLSGKDVTSVLAIGKSAQTYDANYNVTDDNKVTSVQLVGVFAGSTRSTYELDLSNYGQKVDVQAP